METKTHALRYNSAPTAIATHEVARMALGLIWHDHTHAMALIDQSKYANTKLGKRSLG
jgi:hypothetical protein